MPFHLIELLAEEYFDRIRKKSRKIAYEKLIRMALIIGLGTLS